MEWLIFLLPVCLVLVGMALILAVRQDYSHHREARLTRRADASVAAQRAAARNATGIMAEAASASKLTTLHIEEAFDHFLPHDARATLSPAEAQLANQLDLAFDEFIASMREAETCDKPARNVIAS